MAGKATGDRRKPRNVRQGRVHVLAKRPSEDRLRAFVEKRATPLVQTGTKSKAASKGKTSAKSKSKAETKTRSASKLGKK